MLKEMFLRRPFAFILAIGMQMLGAFAGVFCSYLLTLQFDAIRKLKMPEFLLFGSLQLVGWVVSYLALTLADNLWQKQIQEFLHQIRLEITDHLFDDGESHPVANVQNKLLNDLNLIKNNYLTSFRYITGMLVSILTVAASLFTFQWSLLIACIIFAAVQIYLPKVMARPLQKAVNNVSKANQAYLKSLGDWLIGLAEVRRYLAGQFMFKTLAKKAGQLEQAQVEKQIVDQKLDYLNQLAYSIGEVLIFLLTAFLAVNNLAAFGLIASIGNFSSDMFGSLQGISDYRGRMQSTKALREKIKQLRNPIKPSNSDNLKVAAGFQTKNLAVKFANGEEVNLPDLEVKPGEKILLTGDSGTGKSTLFKLILQEEKASQGQIDYLDKNGKKIVPNLAEIGYLPQDPVLFPATIVDNITMFNPSLNESAKQAVQDLQMSSDLAKFNQGLQTQINLDKLNVSGGQRQKILLARSQVYNSRLILIDEGTSAIDQSSTVKILRHLVKTDQTIVFIAHNFSEEMKKLFDREIHLIKN